MRFADLLLDLAAVANASRSVASKHVALRASQVDRYGQTSSIISAAATKGRPHQASQPKQPAAATEKDGEVQGRAAAADEVTTSTSLSEEGKSEFGAMDAVMDENGGTTATTTAARGTTTGSMCNRTSNTRPSDDGGIVEIPTPVEEITPKVTTILQQDTASTQRLQQTKAGFVPAPWATSKPLPTAPPRRPPTLQDGTSSGSDNVFSLGKKGSSIMQALEEAATEALKEEREKEHRHKNGGVELKRDAETAPMSFPKAFAAEIAKNDAHVFGPGAGKVAGKIMEALEKTEAGQKKVEEVVERVEDGVHGEEVSKGAVEASKTGEIDSTTDANTAATATPVENSAPGGQKSTISKEDADLVADLASTHQTPRYELRESRVPSSRIGRLWNYGGLAAGMFAGAIGEGLSRAVGGGSQGSMMLSPANMERLVAKLSRMRGAALKLGQMMSFQDAKMLPAPIQEVLQRVQDRADYMPAWQRDRVLTSNLGQDWRELFGEFEETPIAAASIGQVHRATLKGTGERVAVKIQFPGVADSINSDLDNIAVLLAATKLLPKGLYLNKTIDNARTELAWECDYEREAVCGERYRQLLHTRTDNPDDNDVFVVPRIYPHASGKQVITMEFMDGVGVTKNSHAFTQAQKDWIGTQILRLCLREITEFKFMQTDPNWTNFLYNPSTQKLELLDFGASREFPDDFIARYVSLLEAASRHDRDTIKSLSEELGYLTGHESRAMLDAHITSVTTLAEPFLRSAPEVYDFRDQTITERVKEQIPVMIHERLAPPPEETYSLHRKLSGAFLLCARLGSRVRCRELFEEALKKTGLEFPQGK